LASKFKGKFGEILSTAKSKFDAAKNAILKPIESAKDKVLGIIDKIKGAFSRLSIKIPKPKLPDINVSWKSFGIGDLSVKIPKFSINWHAIGGVFEKPIVFGNAGFGDVEEAIVPFEGRHARRIAGLIAREMDSYLQSQQTGVIQVEVPVILDGREIARGSYRYVTELQQKEQLRTSRFEGR
jgi:phage-related protein